MSFISDLKARLASGDYDPKKVGGGPKVGAGDFVCLVIEASFGKGENGNPRGMFTLKVLNGGRDEEVGGQFRMYIQTVNEDFALVHIKEWVRILVDLGVDESKLLDEDAESVQDVVANLIAAANKLAMKGRLKLLINRKQQPRLDPQGRPQYWNNIVSVIKGDETGLPLPPLTTGPASPIQIQALEAITNRKPRVS